MVKPTQPIEFYDLAPAPGICPYAQRAWIALEELDIPYKTTLIDASNKAPDFVALYQSIVQNAEDSAKVPTIIDGDAELTESLVVVEYLDAKYGGDKPLLPQDPLQRAKVKLFVELFSSKLGSYVYKMLKVASEEEANKMGAELEHNLEVLDKFIAKQGITEGGGYFLGGRFSYAEVCTVPFLRRAVLMLGAHRGFDIPAIVKAKGLKRLEAWMEASLASSANKKTGCSDEQIIQSAKKFLAAPLDGYKYTSAAAA